MPATAAVATIRATELFVFFMPERNTAGAPVSCRDVNKGFVDELHVRGFINEKPRAARRVCQENETGLRPW